MMEVQSLSTGQSQQQNHGESCHPMTIITPPALDQNTTLINSLPPPLPPDAKE